MTQTPGDVTGNESRRRSLVVQTIRDTGSATTTLSGDADAQRRRELALFLKAKRAAVAPQKVGLRPGRRRRAIGLLREEVAQRAGISPTWYTWLEQGREINPSTEVLEQLADALLLTRSERAHVITLARPVATARSEMRFSHEVSAVLRSWIDGLDQAAYVLNGRWDVLAWNEAAEQVFAFGRLPEEDRNTMLLMMTNKQTRKAYGAGWAEVAKRMVAMFRATHDVWAGDPAFAELLTRLRQGSSEFVKWWGAHEVQGTLSGRKTMTHPTKGVLHFEHTSFQANDDPALKLVIYTPV